jgi:hypothetical protein
LQAHNYSVASSPWNSGRGNVVTDFIASCKKFNIRPAVYYSVHANWHEAVCEFNTTDPRYLPSMSLCLCMSTNTPQSACHVCGVRLTAVTNAHLHGRLRSGTCTCATADCTIPTSTVTNTKTLPPPPSPPPPSPPSVTTTTAAAATAVNTTATALTSSKQGAFEDMAIAQLTELATLLGDDLAMLWFDAGVKQGTSFVDRVNSWVKNTLPGA